jgi:hypothetical protein
VTVARLWITCWLLASSLTAGAQQIAFAALAEARSILATPDAYSKTMSDFDRSARLGSARTVTESEFLAFAGDAAREWSAEEKSAIEAALDDIMPALKRLRLPLPGRIVMIKTSGAEDADAAYTRQNAVVFSTSRAATRGPALRRLLAHELFHVASRAHPALADELYRVIGFQRCGAVVLPPAIAARRITNPDAPKDEHCIEVAVGGAKVWALPVIVSRVSRDELPKAGPFLQHVYPVLVLVERPPGGAVATPLAGGDGPRVVDIDAVSGFFEQIGRNTRYVIHPEEIVAENFALLAIGAAKLPSPEIAAGVERVLAQYRAGPQ